MCGLALICTGTGGIKPCVSIFGADQVNRKKEEDKEGKQSFIQGMSSSPASSTMNSEELEKVRTFFSFFSMCINFGAVASFAIIPTVKGTFGFGAAFLIPTIFMCLAILIFTSQSNNYVYRKHNPHGSSLFTTFRLCIWLLHNNLWDNKFFSKNFPSWAPGPVPLPSVIPRNDATVVEGMHVKMGKDHHDDDSSLSSMSISMRSLSRSIERTFHRSRSRSRPRQSPDSRATYDSSNLPSNHPLRNTGRNGSLGSGLEVPSGSPSVSLKSRRRSRSNGLATEPRASSVVSVASLHTTDRYLAQQLSDAARALNVLPVFSMLPCFWMLYDQ
jgi:POT family